MKRKNIFILLLFVLFLFSTIEIVWANFNEDAKIVVDYYGRLNNDYTIYLLNDSPDAEIILNYHKKAYNLLMKGQWSNAVEILEANKTLLFKELKRLLNKTKNLSEDREFYNNYYLNFENMFLLGMHYKVLKLSSTAMGLFTTIKDIKNTELNMFPSDINKIIKDAEEQMLHLWD